MRALVWFREDLRVHDNTALTKATTLSDEVIGLFLIDKTFWARHDMAERRVDFLLRGVIELREALDQLNIPLIIHVVEKNEKPHKTISALMQALKISGLYYNKQYEVNELNRDDIVSKELIKLGIDCHALDDQLILPPNQIKTQQGDYFKVFTAYKRAWYQYFLDRNGIKLQPKIKLQQPIKLDYDNPLSMHRSSFDADLWPAGEDHALRRLKQFIDKKLTRYADDRDTPSIDGTSKLSPYLATGMISARQCFLSAFKANSEELDTGNKGAITWMNELIWRDFYKQILISVPRVSKHQPFLEYTESIPWRNDQKQFEAWKNGQTGIPIVDAAMRQLNQLGWMHNRLRMVVAMFLSKNLLLDWRLGEKYFIQNLIDGDLAANNGGWQWSASTGTDAAPYFRIFNPIRQSERYDPEGEFIKQYCPELKDLEAPAIHDPHTRLKSGLPPLNYPEPIVNLDDTRKRAISAFKSANS